MANDAGALKTADIILIQPWFDTAPEKLSVFLDQLKSSNPSVRISFLDSYAHCDLRLGKAVDPYINKYIKKSIFVDRQKFLTPFRGDTNLSQYYADYFGIDYELVDWESPASLVPKLQLGPGFFTGPGFVRNLQSQNPPSSTNRPIDVHARLRADGSEWYQQMRELSLVRIREMTDRNIVSEGSVSWQEYIKELYSAKVCFSPFGYGELCWRDTEAAMTGAVLVKPDMGHLESLPEVYEPNVTYLPVKWDFSDLHEVINRALDDEELRVRIASNAYERIAAYTREKRFIQDFADWI